MTTTPEALKLARQALHEARQLLAIIGRVSDCASHHTARAAAMSDRITEVMIELDALAALPAPSGEPVAQPLVEMERHGWVRPRADGVKARCGGPAICKHCQGEQLLIAGAAPAAQAAAPAPTGGSSERLLQDQDRGLSQWMAGKPDARMHAREAAAAIAASPAPAVLAEPTDEEIGHVTVEQARTALDSMDDFARMKTSVDAMGPRRTLEVFIDQAERAATPQEAPARVPLTDAQVLRMFNGPGLSPSDRFKLSVSLFTRIWRLCESVHGVGITAPTKDALVAALADDLRAKHAAKLAKDAAHIAAGRCPECEGEGQQGGQFCGGYWPCEACGGSGITAPTAPTGGEG